MVKIMTKQRAIKWLEDAIDVFTIFPIENDEKLEVYKIALAALKEQESRNYNPRLTSEEDLQKLYGKCIWWDFWGGEWCMCKNGYVVVDGRGTFSFGFVLVHGSAYRRRPDENI